MASTSVPRATPMRLKSPLWSQVIIAPAVATDPTATPEQMLTAINVHTASVSSAPRLRYCR